MSSIANCRPESRPYRFRVEQLESRRLLAAEPIITEFLAKNDGGLRDADGRSSDWVEIFNAGDESIDLAGYRLTDDPEELSKWVFPSRDLAPGDYLIVFASGRTNEEVMDGNGNLHTNFTLRRAGDYIALVTPDGRIASQYGQDGDDFAEQLSNVSFGIGQTIQLITTSHASAYTVPLADIGIDWTKADFDAAANGFLTGTAAVGFESRPNDRTNFVGQFDTTLPETAHAAYVRMEFMVDDPSSVAELLLRLKYDNGFIAYVNGVRVASDNAPDNPVWFSTAMGSARRDSHALEFVDIDLGEVTSALVNGTNVLGIHLLNTPSDGSDMLLVAELSATATDSLAAFGVAARTGYMQTPTPGTANVGNDYVLSGFVQDAIIEQNGGFFETPQQVTISTETPGARIYYTTDGSIPSPDSSSATLYDGPLEITSTTSLRATAWADEFVPSKTATRTYVFLADVITQSANGEAPAGWPTRSVRGQSFDYGMDPEIVNDPKWSSQVIEGLTQIPSISIVTDLANLIDPTSGIYVNAQRDGREWERPASIELIDPSRDGDLEGELGFQIDAGLRIRGGFSRGGFNPKHAFRLFFRATYGEGSLEYPLFEDEGVDSFTTVDLRTAQNYAWSNDTFNDQTRNTFLRDVFSRDLQRAQERPYTRSRYYHLYINGQYWGMYQTEERPEASFAEAYLGGDEENYDVIKASGGTLEATDGSLDKWFELWELAQAGFNSLEEYFFIQGRNADGTENPNLEVHVDIDALIDFTLNFVFTGNSDMPTSLGQGTVANNFFAIRDRTGRDGWHFIAHDNEHNMLSVQENQTRDDPAGRVRSSFNPKYLHQQLDEFPEYQLRFADRVQQHLFDVGPMTPERTIAQLEARAEQIDQAIVAESARWGDQHNEPPLTKDTWLAEVDWLKNTFLAERTDRVLRQLRAKDLFPEIAAPVFNQRGGQVDDNFPLTMNAPNGTIYYTLDGTDPRSVGGAVSGTALQTPQNDPVLLASDSLVKARVLSGEQWSPLSVAEFQVGEVEGAGSLRVSEVHFNPSPANEEEIAAGFANNDDFEFIEFVNLSAARIDLDGAALVRMGDDGGLQGVDFHFRDGTIRRLGPGERVLVVEDIEAFQFRYGDALPVAGQWNGRLGNGGEMITVQVDGVTLQQFTYGDTWHDRADGGGASLEIVDVGSENLESWNDASSWLPSTQTGGTPGGPPLLPGDSNRDGQFNAADLQFVLQQGHFEDGIQGNSTFSEGDWNGDGEFDRLDLVFVLQFDVYVP